MTNLPVFLHNMLERPEKVFLEPKIGKFSLFDELRGQLPQRIHREERDILPRTATDSVEMIAENLPNSGPLQSYTTHIIIRNLDYLRERKHAGLCGMRQFFERDLISKIY